MKLLDLLHRWGGGVLGLILAVLGLSGAILVHKEEWIGLPHVGDARVSDPAQLGELADRLLAGANGGESLVFASDRFGLVQLREGTGGLYASQTGETVARWSSQWERPELWLFDLHHHLLTGDAGETVIGVAGLAALVFIVTGTILWWRTRRTYRFRLWPARMTGPAIRIHHRDLGIMAAPLLFVVALTGTMMIFRPVAGAVLAPLSSPAAIEADLTAPRFKAGPLAADLDWQAIIIAAHQAYPDAQLRILAVPKKSGDPVTIRMKRAAEWLPNGRTMLWFDPASGALLDSRDALKMQPGTQAFNMAYPIHAGKVGGLAYRLLLTVVGLALAILGALSVWSFWFCRR
ncbi:PepSY domain-containing protein [Novosphingobium sp. TH158]|uniref:PepSY-associated TM helix domain-containing protein n=1 Tax=Novosphingobium sp. TH158 TaxID=2067455 RepID=UPI000C7C51DC|nr:PepSY-associated TM helix domain-containing protein [Novosphingobium sp. TH158]PLK26712.1 peptidase [Novosphingobium sp. TH158]